MAFLLSAAGLTCLLLGAEALVRGSASLAVRMGLTPLAIGLTVVAFGTSSPELVVSVQATLAGYGDIALGNVVGSNICNMALILGLSVLIRPLTVQAQLLRLDVPIMAGAFLLLWGFVTFGGLSRIEGGVLFLIMVGYTAANLRLARRELATLQAVGADLPPPSRGLWYEIVFIVAGLGLLAFGADLLVDGAVRIARAADVSEAVIGLTIVAIGTSMPELATSVVAAFRGEGDLAIGNVVGSNIFNTFGIPGVAALVRPLNPQNIGLVDFGVMLVLAVLLLPLMRTGFRLVRWEGALLLGLYVGYLVYLVV